MVEAGGSLGDADRGVGRPPRCPGNWPKYAYVALVVLILVVARLQGWWRSPRCSTLYLAVFVWENLLVLEPAVTRLRPLRRPARRADAGAAAGPARHGRVEIV